MEETCPEANTIIVESGYRRANDTADGGTLMKCNYRRRIWIHEQRREKLVPFVLWHGLRPPPLCLGRLITVLTRFLPSTLAKYSISRRLRRGIQMSWAPKPRGAIVFGETIARFLPSEPDAHTCFKSSSNGHHQRGATVERTKDVHCWELTRDQCRDVLCCRCIYSPLISVSFPCLKLKNVNSI